MKLYDETLNDFLEIVDEKISNLEKYKSINDMQNYSIEVHSLKSDVRYLGFMEVGDLAYDLELKSKDNDIQTINLEHPKLISELNNVINICKKYIGIDTEIKNEHYQDPIVNIDDDKKHDIMEEAITYQDPIIEKSEVNKNKDGIILVVEDSNIVANYVKKVSENNYEVLMASNGEEALNLLKEEIISKIKVCFLDLNMPKLNGYEVLKYFKEHNYFRKIPVIIISGEEDYELLEKVKEYPIIDILSKPFNERDIKEAINKCLVTYF